MCKRSLFRALRLTVSALILALLLCEIGLRIIVRPSGPLPAFAPDAAIDERRLSGTMSQYAHSPYWSQTFVKALSQVGDFAYMNEDGQWTTYDFALTGYTVRDGNRITTDQPKHYSRTVWMFGSSTVWGAYVADGWTIPSYLQREFNRRGLLWRVVNVGREGAALHTTYYWLGKTDIRRGDIVIFMDGANELGAALNAAVNRWRAATLPCRIQLPLLLLQAWCAAATSGRVPDSYMDIATFRGNWSVLDSTRRKVQECGATFYHFVQPTSLADDWQDLYRLYARDDMMLTVDKEDAFDAWHYDDDGSEKIAHQIAMLFDPF